MIADQVMVVSVICVMCSLLLDFASAKTWPPPPKYVEKAHMARYLAHYADWGVVSSISPEYGFIPFGTIQSYCDGPLDNSTGTPYFYVAEISDTYKNIKYNNSVTLSISMAESDYCENKYLDPEEPPCARVTLVGKMLTVDNKDEDAFAKSALFKRHPAMKDWPSGHGWNFYKLSLTAVHLLDYYGGASHVPVQDYYNAKP